VDTHTHARFRVDKGVTHTQEFCDDKCLLLASMYSTHMKNHKYMALKPSWHTPLSNSARSQAVRMKACMPSTSVRAADSCTVALSALTRTPSVPERKSLWDACRSNFLNFDQVCRKCVQHLYLQISFL
jgi:hypothetical protein